MNQTIEGISLWLLVPVALIGLSILLWALIDLIRRPADRVRFLPKWAWIAIVLLGNTAGQLIYLFVGRDNTPPAAEIPGSSAEKVSAAADALYGPTGGVASSDARPGGDAR